MLTNNVLALDVGNVRVGVAMARHDIRVPVGLATLKRDSVSFWGDLLRLIKEYQVGLLVLGLPRGLDGQETAQTSFVRQFAQELSSQINIPIQFQDEALTSHKAENTLKKSGKPYEKAEVDKLAACYILEDYIGSAKAAL